MAYWNHWVQRMQRFLVHCNLKKRWDLLHVSRRRSDLGLQNGFLTWIRKLSHQLNWGLWLSPSSSFAPTPLQWWLLSGLHNTIEWLYFVYSWIVFHMQSIVEVQNFWVHSSCTFWSENSKISFIYTKFFTGNLNNQIIIQFLIIKHFLYANIIW